MEVSNEDGNYLVRVRAQVMTRDDSTGGWVPMGAGGLSNVSVCKTPPPIPTDDDAKSDYLIFGKRIADQTVVLSCAIKKDFHYYKVMPTFHHWRTGDKKFGLTFQTAADARAFDKGVRMAIEDLLDGTGDIPNIADLGDDDVFMTLELPIDSRSSSTSSTFSGSGGSLKPGLTTPSTHSDIGSSPYSHPHSNHHLYGVNYPRPYRLSGNPGNNNFGGSCQGYPAGKGKNEEVWTKEGLSPRDYRRDNYLDIEKIDTSGELNSYVQLSRDKMPRSEHDYSYPTVDSYKSGNRDLFTSLKKPQPFDTFSCQPAPRLPVKGKKKKGWKKSGRSGGLRLQCQHCLETYTEADNHRGSCEYAPDHVLSCINTTTCISCAQCMAYHCMSDSEGDFNQHPCSCGNTDRHCPKRWCGLALLSVFVPCLWCYLPLRACHKCGVRCGVCGGRHEPA